MKRRATGWRLWRWPMAIAVVSLVGLLAALVGDGRWDVASWIGLGMPLATLSWFGLRRSGS